MIDFEEEIDKAVSDDSTYLKEVGTFNAHTAGFCRRQMYLSKLGLEGEDLGLQRIFALGNFIHDFLEDEIGPNLDNVDFEEYIPEIEEEGIEWHGRADVVERGDDEAVYDVKTRGGWYNFNPPKQRHIDQVLVYMRGFDVDKGQIVYLSRKDMEVKQWPACDDDYPGEFFTFDEERWEEIMQKCHDVQAAIMKHGFPTCEEEIPFKPCGCYICDQEEIVFPSDQALDEADVDDIAPPAAQEADTPADEDLDDIVIKTDDGWRRPNVELDETRRQNAPNTAWYDTLEILNDYIEENDETPTLSDVRDYIDETERERPANDLSRMLSRMFKTYGVVDRRRDGNLYTYRINNEGEEVLEV